MTNHRVKNIVSTLLNSYSDIFFLKGLFSGFILLLITFINYNAGLSGLLSVLSAYSIALMLGYQVTFLKTGYFTYNALLVGLAIGYLFKISVLSLLMIFIAGSLTVIITIVIAHIFYQLFGLQVLSIPFILVSILVYLSASSFTNLYVVSLYSQSHLLELGFLPFWLSGYFKALGAIIFMPNEVTGCLIALLLLLNSRILFTLSLTGFCFGIVLYGLFTGSIETAAKDVSSFNYILIAMALGGIFNIPSLKSYAIAFLGVAIATIIASAGHVFWSQYGLPIFTLPFTIVTLTFIYMLNLLDYPLRTKIYKNTPEQNLDAFLANQGRYVTENTALSLPFKGRWHCWQGFDGDWTHKGIYRYAYDFVICDSQKKTYCNQGKSLTDYYCFGQEVLSPVRGRVVKVIHYLADNSIGSVDTVNNWGNEITIEDARGFMVKLAHFANQSIYVVEGQIVEVGTVLGLCGNSGQSPQPHIHIQVQYGISVTAATMPFVFVNYEQSGNYHSSGLPEVHSDITHCQFDLYYDQLSNFVLDERFTYDVYLNDQKQADLTFQITMADDLSYYFKTAKGKLYFGKQYGNFYFYGTTGNDPYLSLMYLALSTMPLSYAPQLKWSDNINNDLVLNYVQANSASLLNSFKTDAVSTHADYHYVDENTVKGKVINKFFGVELDTLIKLDPLSRFKEIEVAEYRFVLQSKI
ncbi:MAG: peptidoglycan DD-metalloendopeptidase family protein [Methylococcales bacterium]|jgi:urea transporter/murein DD-endopeptidase MepM/ murein hydrolase activator NlpD|nr:peptidoglycan DD-metalloendopeptidase family protein [Methylococcales bacterium]MBT7409485.1 peptidoglycan DD-metalloendopeptidase family protein [Methylococcales bacterium]